MSTGSVIDSPLKSAAPARSARDLGGVGRLALIVAVHVGFVAAIASGVTPSTQHAVAATPVMVSFVTAAPAPAPQPIAQAEPPPPEPAPKPQPKPKPKPKPKAKAKSEPKPKPLPDKPVARPAEPDVAPAAAELMPAPMAQAQEPAPALPAPPGPVAPPVPPTPPTPPTISSGIQYLQAPSPEYPSASRRMGEEGQVMMRVYVNERGRPERAEVHASSGSARLDEAARRAVLRAVFKPHIESGRPVPVFALIPIRFQLDS